MTTIHIYPGSKVEVVNVTPGKRILAIGRHSGGVTEIITDPRTPEQIAWDEFEREVIETRESDRPQ